MKKISNLVAAGLAIIMAFGHECAAQGGKKTLTLEAIWASGNLRTEMLQGIRSMGDGKSYTVLEQDRGNMQVKMYDYKSGKEKGVLISADMLVPQGAPAPIQMYNYVLSMDEKMALIFSSPENIYRHSTREMVHVLHLKTKKLTPVGDQKIMHAALSPDGSKVGYVRDNNLYYFDIEKNEHVAITEDGALNAVINGATDWVYEEEFSFDKAWFWSPAGSRIAFYKFDETLVKEFNMPTYGSLYPSDYRFKYPKAGEDNAQVSIYIYDLASKKTTTANLGKYEYIPRIKWTNSEDFLAVTSMNRHQNLLRLNRVNASTGGAELLLMESSKTYIDIHDNLYFLKDNGGFLWTSEESGYNHIYRYDAQGKNKQQITSGRAEVTKVYGLDEEKGLLYFQRADQPSIRDVYVVALAGGEPRRLGTALGSNNAYFNKGFTYYINHYSSVVEPGVYTLHTPEGKQVREVKNNNRLKEQWALYKTSEVEFTTLTTDAGDELEAYIIKPTDFDSNKKYPVLMHVYGGPGSQTVRNTWGGANYFWHMMLAQKGYVVVSVDNRGTGGKGEGFKKMTYKQLGKLETEDQIAAAQSIGRYPWVDASRIGIWGWSYGGYMSSLCLFKGADVFKMAIAVAPVTNWKFYDSIYTERYMQTPAENSGYDENSPITHVDKLRGKYLLIHGTADDNVHFQNTVEMVSALQKAGKLFDLMIYPNRNHGIYGGNTRLHLYELMTDYVEKNL